MPLLRLLHQITNMYQNVKDAQDELCDQPTTYRNTLPLKDESSLASEINDPTIMESIEPLDTSLLDEHYDKFNESYQLGHSNSRNRMPTLAPLIPLTPSPGLRRPQSFAQKLKSTSKTVKGKLGYTNLNESILTPIKKSPTMSTDNTFRISKANAEHQQKSFTSNIPFGIGEGTNISSSSNILLPITADIPICWKTMFHLLELYATMPETKTVAQRYRLSFCFYLEILLNAMIFAFRVSVSPDPAEKTAKKLNISQESKVIDIEDEIPTTPLPTNRSIVPQPERTRLIVFGVAKIQRTRLLATLSGLKV